ncbi:hypothetical protein C8J57DRAFT_1279966 [Mycena rebaudengoi]|nr:hypothetical protein C8J57DRAFT_1279966 [Mycena rebaudengoi]
MDHPLIITNARLAYSDQVHSKDLWRIECRGGRVFGLVCLQDEEQVVENNESLIDAKRSLVLPSLCHSHIHLDKCFILDRCELVTGDFAEAMKVTNHAKALFDSDDLYRRGYDLIRDSLECGVTSMRAHVEVDTTVQLLCLEVGLKLSDAFRGVCDVQVAAFAQEPLFSTARDTKPGPNYDLLVQAAQVPNIEVIGSAPYVEPTTAQSKSNITLILKLALKHRLHVDFHLDYNLDLDTEPLIYEVISEAKKLSWGPELRITVGHATRMQLFTPTEWQGLKSLIGDLPIIFVSLPQSDMYMLGRAHSHTPLGPPRSTLRITDIANNYGFEMAMSVNNAQNAFTPQGSMDPLSLCTLGIALFQSATLQDIATLIRAVTLTSKRAISLTDIHRDLAISKDDPADFVILHGTPDLQAAALNPSYERTTVRSGVVVARRRVSKWFAAADAVH